MTTSNTEYYAGNARRTCERLSEAESLEIVTQVANGNSEGLEHLYGIINRFRHYFLKHLGPREVDDCVHQIFLVAAGAITKGLVRSPERLLEFLSGVIRNSMLAKNRHARSRREVSIHEAFGVSDSRPNPEGMAYELELREIQSQLLAGMSCKHHEILYRFYVEEQPKEQIRREMHLTDTQFRLLKSRAMTRLSKRAQAGLVSGRFSATNEGIQGSPLDRLLLRRRHGLRVAPVRWGYRGGK